MNKDLLVVNLFVHDMKAPLAVIGSGADRLQSGSTVSDEAGSQEELIQEILNENHSALVLLNQILKMDNAAVPIQAVEPGTTGSKSKQGVFRQMAAALFETRKKCAPSDLFNAIQSLDSHLIKILNAIDVLRRHKRFDTSGGEGDVTLQRMRRNVKTAIHYAQNALAVLKDHGEEKQISSCRIADIIQPAMVEVFDLLDPVVSEQARSADSLARLTRILNQKEVGLQISEDQWDQKIEADPDKIKQVIVNLLINAMKFRKMRIEVKAEIDTCQVTISVVDDGQGIAEKDRQFVFKNRFQVKSADDFPIRGHGIGLAGAQALLEGQNGYLALDDAPGGYTRFSAVLKQAIPES